MALNLLPSQAKFQAEKMKLHVKVKKYLVVVVTVWLIAVVAVLAYMMTIRFKLNKLVTSNSKLMDSYKKDSKQVLLSNKLKYQVKQIGQILDRRFEYGPPFKMIENLFPKEIVVSSYQLTEGTVFRILGRINGNKNVAILEDREDDINNGLVEGFSKAKIVSLSAKNGLWNFTMEVEIQNGSK